jgi:hypothetical protein
LCASNSSVSYACFFLRSAQRRFIASDNRFLPSGVKPPRLRFFVVDPFGLPMRFLPLPPDKADPNNAEIARPSLSLSFVKSDTNLFRSKVCSFGGLLSAACAFATFSIRLRN